MKTNLNEEIQKNLKLMGLLNESSPSKGIFRIIFNSLLGPTLDNAIKKIETKAKQKLTGKGINAFESAISAGWITRKEATKIMVQALIDSGRSIDDIAASVATTAPNFMKSVERASKAGVDRAEVKAAVPELAELSDDLVDAMLKRGGYEKIGSTIADTNQLMKDYVAQFPELFQKNGLFKRGEYKNAAMIANVQQKLFKRFAGKNKAAIADEVKKIIEEANNAIKNSSLPDTEKKKWFDWLSENTPQTVKDVLSAGVKRDEFGDAKVGTSIFRYYKGILLISLIPAVVTTSWVIAKNTTKLANAVDDKLDSIGQKNYEYSPAGFIEFLNDTEGKNDYGNKDLFTTYIDTPTGNIEITGNQDKVTKKFRYLNDKKRFEKIED